MKSVCRAGRDGVVVLFGNSEEDGEGKVGEGGEGGGEFRSKGSLPGEFESLLKRALRAFAPMLSLLLGSADEVPGPYTVLWKNRETEPREIEAFGKESTMLVNIWEDVSR